MFNVSTETAHAFTESYTIRDLQRLAPAVFATEPFAKTSATYKFIPTAELVAALLDAGFEAVAVRQARAHGERVGYARHMLRFRHVRESITLIEAVPEIILINSHDATSSYQLRAGLFRPLCSNGLIVRIGDFGVINVPHRGNIVANVVDSALALTKGFADIGETVRRMAGTVLSEHARNSFARQALRIRYHAPGQHIPIGEHKVLETRRYLDEGVDLWRTYNVVQENLMRGGLAGQSARGRQSVTRRIGAIREGVRINTGLWQLAMTMLRS